MGIALSMQKFLATPLAAQWKFPFVVNPRFCRRRVTTFELADNFWTHAMDIHGYAVREVDSGRTLFRVMPAIDGEVSDGYTKWLVDEYGIPVAHLTHRDQEPQPNTRSYDVCLGKRRQPLPKVLTTLIIKCPPGRGEPLLAEVDDLHAGGKSRLGCHGMWRQRAAVLYLERGRGGRREPIAKVYRPASNRMTTTLRDNNGYHVETAIGVDMALVLLVCAAMDDANVHLNRQVSAHETSEIE
uniref:Tubby C-terminal domain-containing protein n=1 Tax=Hyaloperonospora arabidopsidis (strain Emoy2) TaxID=559515 RepID=M4BBP8_HYAAE